MPEGLRSVTPFLQVHGVDGLLAFAKKAFGAETVSRHADPAGVVRHAVLKLEGSAIELGEATASSRRSRPCSTSTSPTSIARTSGRWPPAEESMQPPADQPYGHRTAAIRDAFGNQWYVARPTKG